MKTTLLLCLALSFVAVGCSENHAPETKTGSAAETRADLAAGRALAERACKGCHGLDGRVPAPGIPKLASQRPAYLLASLNEYAAGKRPHAPFDAMSATLSEADRRNVAAYYATISSVKSEAAEEPRLSPYEEGKALSAVCSSCHGREGNGSTTGTPSLAGQQPYYLINAIRARHGVEAHATASLTRVELEKVALYFASQRPVQRGPSSVGNAVAGRATAAACAGCHGVDGVSDDSMTPNLAGQDASYLVHTMKTYRTSRQHGALQRYIAGLSDQDVDDIVAFYAAEQPRAARSSPSAAKEMTEKCDRCHDPEREGTVAPILRGQDKDYLVMALRGYRDGRRENSPMHQMSSVYGNVLIDSIASWYASESSR